jgi:hypothetical protein
LFGSAHAIKWEQNKPTIPSEENPNRIIVARALRGIDLEKESIKIGGRKGHASRAIKLKPNMIEMLKT